MVSNKNAKKPRSSLAAFTSFFPIRSKSSSTRQQSPTTATNSVDQPARASSCDITSSAGTKHSGVLSDQSDQQPVATLGSQNVGTSRGWRRWTLTRRLLDRSLKASGDFSQAETSTATVPTETQVVHQPPPVPTSRYQLLVIGEAIVVRENREGDEPLVLFHLEFEELVLGKSEYASMTAAERSEWITGLAKEMLRVFNPSKADPVTVLEWLEKWKKASTCRFIDPLRYTTTTRHFRAFCDRLFNEQVQRSIAAPSNG